MQTMYEGINNSIYTTLTSSIAAADTTINVASTANLPTAPNIATIGTSDAAEVVLYTGTTATSLTGCTRGFGGTTAAAWAAGEYVYRAFTKHDHDSFRLNITGLYDSSMRKIISRTIATGENVSSVTWTQDDDGVSLSLLEMRILLYIPANSIAVGTSGTLRLRINDQSGASDYQYTTYVFSSFPALNFRTSFGAGKVWLSIIGNIATGTLDYSYSDGTTLSGGMTYASTHFSLTSINKIHIYINAAGLTYIPDGTVIEIWRRTA